MRAQRLRDVAALAQVQAVERLVGQQHRLRHQQTRWRAARACAGPSTALPIVASSSGSRSSRSIDLVAQVAARPLKEPMREIERPAHRLRRPRRDARRAGRTACDARSRVVSGRPSCRTDAAVERQHAAQTLEQRGLARAVRADQAEHFARRGPRRTRRCSAVSRPYRLVRFRGLKQAPSSPDGSAATTTPRSSSQPRRHRAATARRLAEKRLPGGAEALELVQLVAGLARLRHHVDPRLTERLRRGRAVGRRGPLAATMSSIRTSFRVPRMSTPIRGASSALPPESTCVTRNIGGTSDAARSPIAY